MELEIYKQKLKELDNEYDEKKNKLSEEYALSNNSIKIGDRFTDHIGTIIVEKIKWTFSGLYGIPSCVYLGLELKKDGTQTKKMTKRLACNAV